MKNPLENAISSVIERTEKLRELISSNPIEPHIQSIESSVHGIVMPFVSGGYENYTVRPGPDYGDSIGLRQGKSQTWKNVFRYDLVKKW